MARRRRFPMEGHGPLCSSNPEIGCVCGAAEEASERSERLAPAATVSHPAVILKAAS
jgi:hypothetical protein